MQCRCRQVPQPAPRMGSAPDPVLSLPTRGQMSSIPRLCVGQEVRGQAGTPRSHGPPWLTSARLWVLSPKLGCLTTLHLPHHKPPLGAGAGLQSPAPAGTTQLMVGVIPTHSHRHRDDHRCHGRPARGTPPYLHRGPLQHLDGIFCREVELGFADPAREVVAHRVGAQLVGDLEVQRLLAPAHAAVPCDGTPEPPEKRSPVKYLICCVVS